MMICFLSFKRFFFVSLLFSSILPVSQLKDGQGSFGHQVNDVHIVSALRLNKVAFGSGLMATYDSDADDAEEPNFSWMGNVKGKTVIGEGVFRPSPTDDRHISLNLASCYFYDEGTPTDQRTSILSESVPLHESVIDSLLGKDAHKFTRDPVPPRDWAELVIRKVEVEEGTPSSYEKAQLVLTRKDDESTAILGFFDGITENMCGNYRIRSFPMQRFIRFGGDYTLVTTSLDFMKLS